MTERTPLAPALGLVRDRLAGPPPRRPTTPTTTGAQSSPPPTADEEATTSQETTSPDKASPKTAKSPRPKASESSTGGNRRTTLSLPQDLVERLRAHRHANPQVSQVQIILNALATTAPQLKELVASESHPDGLPNNDLFPDSSTLRRTVDQRTTISFDTTHANLKVLDSLVETAGADSRSQLVRVALHAALEPDTSEQ